MRAYKVVFVLFALALAGCAAEANMTGAALVRETPSPSPSPSSSPTVGLIPNASSSPLIATVAEDLRPALLTAADLPAGYLQVAAASNGTGSVSIGGGSFPGCPSLAPMTDDRTVAAAVSFSKGVMGPYVTNAVVKFPAGGAAEAMTRLASVPTSCRSFSQQLAGLTVRFQVGAAALPVLGDQTVGVRMTGTTDFNISVTAEIVAIRRGDVVIWLNDMTVGSAPGGLVEGLAKVASARCADRLKDC